MKKYKEQAAIEQKPKTATSAKKWLIMGGGVAILGSILFTFLHKKHPAETSTTAAKEHLQKATDKTEQLVTVQLQPQKADNNSNSARRMGKKPSKVKRPS